MTIWLMKKQKNTAKLVKTVLNIVDVGVVQFSGWFCNGIQLVHTVDDGTGVITCLCWKTPFGDQDLHTLPQLSGKFMQSVFTIVYWLKQTSKTYHSSCAHCCLYLAPNKCKLLLPSNYV